MPVLLDTFRFGKPLFIFSLAFSTMDFARRLAELNFPEGTAVVAGEQIAGRGTKGRSWHSARGKGLYVSFLLRPTTASLNLLPAAAGLAAAEAMEELSGVRVKLKWPNDLVHHNKKIGGILCEAGSSGRHADWVVAGIGLNLNHRQADFPPEISGLATSLYLITGKSWSRDLLLAQLGSRLQVWYNKLEKGQKDSILENFEGRLSFHRGQRLLLRTLEGELEGEFCGLDERGGLKLRVGPETRIFHASEIIRVLS
ncbi:MAG: biotin--[acetyl-CoA-carboxylase] ligase [Candidatus Saccharicenans sp.]|nr:biotin--[acetyl-CoA-carboxylase] ligase [Candidatus Saccharicenans sp.]MDH7493345.1 biotin--[acetyl-CoA-carboxylase] ligase [Candidatus Saccharicenans sp.]